MPFPMIARFACVAAFAFMLAGCAGGVGPVSYDFDPDLPKPHDYPVNGIDVSKYQGNVDWNAVAGAGVKFAWIKASEGGDRVDPMFQANWNAARTAGVARGAYHFMYWCRDSLEQIKWMEQNVPVEPDALPPVLDLEATPDSRTCRRHLEKEPTLVEVRVALQEMERYFGKRPVIYTSVDFYEAILSDGAFSDYPMWVRSTKHHPAVRYGSRKWVFWQYQADGRIPGIDGKVDRNVFHGTEDQWKEFLAQNQPQ